MKKIIAIALALAMMLVLIPAGSVFAAKTDTVTITMTGGTLSIDVTPDDPYDFGEVVQDTSYTTTSVDAEYTLTNDGTVEADIDIHGANTTGGSPNWALAANPAGDTYALDFQRAAAGGWNSILTTDSNYMYDLASLGTDTFGLQLWTPTTISDTANQQSAVITFTASQSL